MLIRFYKYHGAGNDFIIIDNREELIDPANDLVHRLCDRHFGIGADGLILLENDDTTDFSMRYFNADGNEGTMCGNGGRCIVLFAARLGLIDRETRFTAIDGLHQAEINGLETDSAVVKLKMGDVENFMQKQNQWIIDTGSPHLVLPVENLDEIDIYAEGKKIRYSELFADEGINVNFVQKSGREINIRTYERGVENETLACGTGSVAAAIAGYSENNSAVSPMVIRARGGVLKVYLQKEDNKFTDIWLEGPATQVFTGQINI